MEATYDTWKSKESPEDHRTVTEFLQSVLTASQQLISHYDRHVSESGIEDSERRKVESEAAKFSGMPFGVFSRGGSVAGTGDVALWPLSVDNKEVPIEPKSPQSLKAELGYASTDSKAPPSRAEKD
ncbi:uncharacterized protein L203_100816 [Cryptococcus depauperatus CBS 7841]|uniref:Uncharacterized protein n=1 Tax=Cryptococcus depauperatus CBS 7841 TaxID=1295531 RepID=A0A1E3IY35_9TREE|nr:hypothetical protein L203_00606 [Cryptococcus depauperatus CBS 7841]